MAPLTWRNVDAPNLNRASRILDSAVKNFGEGFGGLSDTLGEVRDRQRRDRSADQIPMLAKVANEQGADAALAQLGQNIDPRDMSPELQQAMMNLRGQALGYEDNRAVTDGRQARTASTRAATGRAQTQFDRAIARDDQLAGLTSSILAQEERDLGFSGGGQRGAPGGNPADGGPLNDREILARTLMAEAGGEGVDGMLAVGSVIGNRARTGRYGEDLRSVILAPGQFSAWNGMTGYANGEGGLDMANMTPNENAYKAADAILSGEYQDPTGGATHYYAPGTVEPEWGRRAGGNWRQQGNHVFGVPAGEAGVPQNAPPLSALVQGENNLIRPQDVAGINSERFDNRARGENRAQELLGRQEQAYAEELQGMSREWAQSVMPQLPSDLTEVVRDIRSGRGQWGEPGLTYEEREARVASLQELQSQDPEYFQLPSGSEIQFGEETEAQFADVSDATAFTTATDPNTNLLEQVLSGSSRNTGEVFAEYQTMANDAEMTPLNESQFMRVAQNISQKYNISQGQAAELALGALRNGNLFNGETRVDERTLRAQLENVIGSRENLSNVKERSRNRSRLTEQAGQIRTEMEELAARQEYWSQPGRDPETARKRLKKIDEELNNASKDLAGLRDRAVSQAESWEEIQGLGNQEDSGNDPGQAALDFDFSGSGSGTSRPPVDTSVPSPDGSAVNPEASQFDRAVSGFNRERDIRQEVSTIAARIGTEFSPVARGVDRIQGLFQPRAEAELNAQERRTGKEASDWYNSNEAIEFFRRNPGMIEEAKQDPVAFWLRMQNSGS